MLFAHRGGGGLAPENTLAAFDNGIALGADGLELDVHLARDGVAVVHHDATLERTTNLRGAVVDRTADELASADAGYRFCRDGERPFRGRGIGVPALADVLARYRDARLIIELKVNSPELARAVVAEVRTARAIDRVCLGSFGLRVLRAARALGVRNTVIMFRHVLPNAMVATITFLPFILNGSITTLTSLDFLGFGLPPGSPSLGEMLAQGKANLQAPWIGLTGFFVLAVMLSLLIFVGEAVRDAFDPRKTV